MPGSASAGSARGAGHAPRRRAGFILGGSETPAGAGGSSTPTVLDGLNDQSRILDDQEQDEIVKQLSALSQQSSLLWRVASLVLGAVCFAVCIFIPLPWVPQSPLKAIYTRPVLLLEVFLGSFSCLTEFVTTLPEPKTPSRRDMPHMYYTLSLKEKLHHVLQLPPELSSSNADARARLRLVAPLLAALAVAATRTAANAWFYYQDKMRLDEVMVYSSTFLVLLISFLARSYANDLDRDLGELQKLKYANKGA